VTTVRVFNVDGLELSPTHPARARILVSDGRAVFGPEGVYLIRHGVGDLMTQTQQSKPGAPTIANFTDFFREPRDIYVQNIGPYQISLSFKTPNGDTLSFLLPKGLDPHNLTQTVPFDIIKESADFRRMVNRRPAVMRVLTEAEYNKYFEEKAARLGKSADILRDQAISHQQRYQQKTADASEVAARTEQFTTSIETDPHTLVIKDEETIHPRVLHLMQQVSSDVSEAQRMPAAELIDQLESLLGELNDDSLECIRARGYWKTVKAWAARVQLERSSQHEGDG